LDIMILVQDGRGTENDGKMIVEVVKDRIGDRVGQWADWKSK